MSVASVKDEKCKALLLPRVVLAQVLWAPARGAKQAPYAVLACYTYTRTGEPSARHMGTEQLLHRMFENFVNFAFPHHCKLRLGA